MKRGEIAFAPPKVLVEPVSEPVFTGTTNEDLLDYIDELRRALAEANGKLKALKEEYGAEK